MRLGDAVLYMCPEHGRMRFGKLVGSGCAFYWVVPDGRPPSEEIGVRRGELRRAAGLDDRLCRWRKDL